jgi:hypothetical protein
MVVTDAGRGQESRCGRLWQDAGMVLIRKGNAA